MEKMKEIRGFALLCDSNGIISDVLRDDFGLANSNPSGKLFANLIDNNNRHLSLNFLLEIKRKKISFDYRFNIPVNNKIHNFYCLGILLDENLLIIGADNHKEAINFTNHLQQINNEQSNFIRHLVKKDADSRIDRQNESRELFDEITKLNNELVNLQRELTRKNTELERLNELKNRFLGMAAHDLRNPLGVILNFSEFLMEDLENDLSDEHLKFLKNIYKSSGFMLHLVEDLLDYSKIESGKIELNISEFDFMKQIKKMVEINNTIATKKEIKILLETNYDALNIKADANKLEQVFNNLIGNAIKFSYPKSKIIVSLEEVNGEIRISVKDNGIGISPENTEKIFTPFHNASSKGTSGEKSTGLGLSIVKRIVEAHKGKIWLESNPDKGTTFYVEFPKL